MQPRHQEIYVLTRTIAKRMVLEASLTVNVGKMKSELSKAERTLLADNEFHSYLKGSCCTQACAWEQHQRFTIHGTTKLPNDDDSLERFSWIVKGHLTSMALSGKSVEFTEVLPMREDGVANATRRPIVRNASTGQRMIVSLLQLGTRSHATIIADFWSCSLELKSSWMQS